MFDPNVVVEVFTEAVSEGADDVVDDTATGEELAEVVDKLTLVELVALDKLEDDVVVEVFTEAVSEGADDVVEDGDVNKDGD